MNKDGLDFLNEESRQYFDDLSGKIKSNQVVLFAGAGLSRNAHRRDNKLEVLFPLWSDLTRKMLEELYGSDREKIEKEKNDYLNVADRYEAQFGRKALVEIIEKSMEDPEFEPGDIHQLISLFDWEILTTNYDTLIERGFELANKTYNLILSDSDLVDKEKPRIIKINGCLKHAKEQIIITSEGFRTFPEKKPLIELYVKKCFVESTVLFVGFSLYDPAFQMIHGWVRDRLLQSRHNRFAYSIQSRVDEPTRKVWYSRGIHIVELSPEGPQDYDLIKKRLFSFFHELYKRQKEDPKTPTEIKTPIPPNKKKLEGYEKSIEDILTKARRYKKESKLQCPTAQAELANEFISSIKKNSFQEIFSQVTNPNLESKKQKTILPLARSTYLLNNYFFEKQKENIMVQLLKEMIIQIEREGGRLYEDKEVSRWVTIIFSRFSSKKKKSTEIKNPNIWIMALYIALRIGVSQPLLSIDFFRKGFAIIRETALKGAPEQKVSQELHRYWLFSVILTGNFQCAETLLNISRKIQPQVYPWDIDEYIHFNLEVFFDDHQKCRELFLRTVNKFKTSNTNEAFFKFYLLDTFLKKYSKQGEYRDLLLNRTHRELYGIFREEFQQFQSSIASIPFPIRENYFKTAIQAVFNAVNQGKFFMFTGLADIILSAPVLTIEKNDIDLLKNTSLGELFLMILIYDNPTHRKDKELKLKQLVSLFIDSGVVKISYFLDLLLLRLEGANLEHMYQGVDNGFTRYLSGFTTFVECALPSMEEDDLFKVKKMIEYCLPQIKLPDIRERMIGIIGYILNQFPEGDSKEFNKILSSIFSLATRGQFASLGLKFLTLTNNELGKPDIVKHSQIRLIFDQSLEREGSPFDRDFIAFLLKHKPEDLFEKDDLIDKSLRNYFDSKIKEANQLSFQWLMDIQQYIKKNFIDLNDDLKKIIGYFIKQTFSEIMRSNMLREWKRFSEEMTDVYQTLAEFFTWEMIREVIEEFFKDTRGNPISLQQMEPTDRDHLAHFLKVVYSLQHHSQLNDFILEKIEAFADENHVGAGHMAAFWPQLNPDRQEKLSAAVLDLWAPTSEQDIADAITTTGEFLKYPTDKSPEDKLSPEDELSQRFLFCIFTGSDLIKIRWIAAIKDHIKENSPWFQKHKERILDTLSYLKSGENLDFLREYVNLLGLFQKDEVELIFSYLAKNAPYAEIRRFAAHRVRN